MITSFGLCFGKPTNDGPADGSLETARERQRRRFVGLKGLFANGDMGVGEIRKFCELTNEAKHVLDMSVQRMQLSARAYHRVLKLSRTIADLDEKDIIEVQHV